MSFQDELRKRVPVEEDHRQRALLDAQKHFGYIKRELMTQVSKQEFSNRNGSAAVSCIINIPSKYLHTESWDNSAQIRANNRKLFKNPFLTPEETKTYSVEPKYEKEFQMFKQSLRELAEADSIEVTVILYNRTLDRERPFPTKLMGVGECHVDYYLAVRATTIFEL